MLYLVPTPIGNLEDMTFRAVRILQEVDLILAEDTRTSAKLLRHYQIEKRVFAHHQHNEHKALTEIMRRLADGQSIALISDAGTPGISDPGFLLVREAIKLGFGVCCLPGATAFVPALVMSGLPSDAFVFEGFLPVKKGRQTKLQTLSTEQRTLIFYESPHRLLKTLTEFSEFFGPSRPASVSREISKVFEETIRGSLEEIIRHFEAYPDTVRGEFVVCVQGAEKAPKAKKYS